MIGKEATAGATGQLPLHEFIEKMIEPDSTVITDGFNAYQALTDYTHLHAIQ